MISTVAAVTCLSFWHHVHPTAAVLLPCHCCCYIWHIADIDSIRRCNEICCARQRASRSSLTKRAAMAALRLPVACAIRSWYWNVACHPLIRMLRCVYICEANQVIMFMSDDYIIPEALTLIISDFKYINLTQNWIHSPCYFLLQILRKP